MVIGRIGFGLLCGLMLSGCNQAQVKARPGDGGTASVLMLSDIHFDPYRDPAKAVRLAKAPVAEWAAILKEPDAADPAPALAALQGCGGRNLDSDPALFEAALKAAKKQAPDVKFVMVSGDLLVHQFDCRYGAEIKDPDKKNYSDFAAKTTSYVMDRVAAEFPGAPVYVALGNNDSGCGDYRLDLSDRYLTATSKAVLAGLRGASAEELKQAEVDFDRGGYFAVTLPSPIERTRLLVVDDKFMSRKYQDCAGSKAAAGAAADVSWLQKQMDGAAQRGEKVWVMGHIPPGIDVYSTVRRGRGNVCGGTDTFLGPPGKDALGDMMAAHTDVITLGVFGHTHMDEMKLIGPEGKPGIPVKGVGSISPVNGNLPSFTVAEMDGKTAGMRDYVVYRAPNKTGVGGPWAREYGFRDTYHKASYSGAAVKEIVDEFHGDPGSATDDSQAYEKYFDTEMNLVPIALLWQPYACGIDHYTEAGYQSCACGAK